jgi:hypothetical protein
VKKSTSSRLVKGYIAPMPPMTVEYSSTCSRAAGGGGVLQGASAAHDQETRLMRLLHLQLSTSPHSLCCFTGNK